MSDDNHRAPRDEPAALSSRATGDIGFVTALALLYVLSRRFPNLGLACAVAALTTILGFAWLEWRRGPRPLRDVGLRTDNLRPAAHLALAVLGPLLLLSIIYAAVRGVHRPGHFALALLAYPFWGFVQQLVFQGVLLEAFRRLGHGAWGVVITSVLFVAVHYPSPFLMAFTALGAPLFSWVYLKRPNILPLALFHGVLGAFLYYVFRDKDVLAGLAL